MYGSLGYRRLRTKVVEKVKLPRLKDFTKLSLGDLKKVKGYCELYHSEDGKRLETIQRLEEDRNQYESRSRAHDDLSAKLDAEIKALDSESYSLFWQTFKFKQGFFSNLLVSREKLPISYILPSGETLNKMIVKTPESMALKARLDDKNKDCVAARKKRAELQSIRPMRSSGSYASNFAHFCKDTKTFTINGTRVEISVDEINITELECLIQSHNRKIEKLGDLRARAASNVLETRRLAQSERRNINKQLDLLNCCPYCAKDLSALDAHLDHIYPVSKGGLSRQANLIFVCSSCNIKKRDSTLRSFIEETGLDAKTIHGRLASLAKDF